MLIFVIYAVVLALILRKFNFFKTEALSGWGMYTAFVIKLIVALLFFSFPYDTMIDSGHYMHDAEVLSRVLYENPGDFFKIYFGFGDVQSLNEQYLSETTYWSHDKGWVFSDTRNVIRVNAIFQWLAFHNPRVVLLFNVLVCLIGLRWIYEGLSRHMNSKHNLLFLLLFFLPSTLLWTANLSKEVFLIFGLGLVLRNVLSNRHLHYNTALGILILFLLKPYVGAGFLIAWLIYILLMQQNKIWRWSSLAIFAVNVGVMSHFLAPRIAGFISQKQFDFVNLAEGGIWLDVDGEAVRINDSDTVHLQIHEADNKNFYALITAKVAGEKRMHREAVENIKIEPSDREYYVLHRLPKSGSYIALQPIDGKFSNLIASIPSALFNTFLRPTPKDPPKSIIKWYFVLETYLFMLILLYALTKIRASKQDNLLIFLGIASISIALIIGWTTPVLGAIVRYKLPITLAIIAASCLLLFPKIDTREPLKTLNSALLEKFKTLIYNR
jgi:hypothetical protein